MSRDSFEWSELQTILEELMRLLWNRGFATDVCGDPLVGYGHPLERVEVTHSARPKRNFKLVSTPHSATEPGTKFDLMLEVGGDRSHEAFFHVGDSAHDIFGDVVENFFVFAIERDEASTPPANDVRWTLALESSRLDDSLVIERGDDLPRPNGNLDLGVKVYTYSQVSREQGKWLHSMVEVNERLGLLLNEGDINQKEHDTARAWVQAHLYFYSEETGYNPESDE